MTKSKDEELLDNMKMLKDNLEKFRVKQWREIRSKYFHELHDLLKEHDKL